MEVEFFKFCQNFARTSKIHNKLKRSCTLFGYFLKVNLDLNSITYEIWCHFKNHFYLRNELVLVVITAGLKSLGSADENRI